MYAPVQLFCQLITPILHLVYLTFIFFNLFLFSVFFPTRSTKTFPNIVFSVFLPVNNSTYHRFINVLFSPVVTIWGYLPLCKIYFITSLHFVWQWVDNQAHSLAHSLSLFSFSTLFTSFSKAIQIIGQRKAFYWQRIPDSSCARKQTLDRDILVTSRNGERKTMQSIRTTGRPILRKRKWSHLIQFR